MRYKQHPEVISHRLEKDIIILHLETNRFYELNETAARLWELLSTGQDLAHIKDTLTEEYAVSASDLDNEIKDVLTTLIAEKFVGPLDAVAER